MEFYIIKRKMVIFPFGSKSRNQAGVHVGTITIGFLVTFPVGVVCIEQ